MPRLVIAFIVLIVATALPADAQHGQHHIAMPDTMTWVDPPTFPGAKLAIVQGDPSKEGLELPVGGFVSIPAEHAHFAYSGKEETLIQVHGVGPTDIRFVNPDDDPRKKK
jgi:hypothetical protein